VRRFLALLLVCVPLGTALVFAVVAASDPYAVAAAGAAAGALLGAALIGAIAWLYLRQAVDPVAEAAGRIAADGDVDVTLPRRGDRRVRAGFGALAGALAEARRESTIDRLTGVATRGAVVATLGAEVERAARYDRRLSVAFVDVDHFKSVNDRFGHDVGDTVLRAIAQAIRSALRTTDAVGRYGGEEFVIVLPETSIDDAAAISEKLRSAVEGLSVPAHDGSPVTATISVGITSGRGRSLRLDELLRSADAAMYAAKALGRNQVAVDAVVDRIAPAAAASMSRGDAARAAEVGVRGGRATEYDLVGFVHGLPEGGGRPSDAILEIVETLATASGLSPADVEKVRLAAILRDVGKIAIPVDLVTRESPLAGAEWQLLAQHPRIGQVLLEQSAAFRDVAPLVLHHHERWSGHGYPDGLSGERIPLGARIVAIADTYDALVAPRPGDVRATHDEAYMEVVRRSGSHFDPELVSIFQVAFAMGVPGRTADPSVDAVAAQDGATATGPAAEGSGDAGPVALFDLDRRRADGDGELPPGPFDPQDAVRRLLEDPVTGVGSGLAWDRWVADERARERRHHRPTTIVVAEVADLDVVATFLGPAAATWIVTEIADIVRANVRASDHAALVGPARFAILLPETDEVRAVNFVERVRAACDRWLEANAPTVGVGFGWANPTAEADLVAARAVADQRLAADLRVAPVGRHRD
jgi:diguanylate cyclase (GGDEF)-like protein